MSETRDDFVADFARGPHIAVYRDRITGGLQIEIGDETGGHRLHGPKFLGASDLLGWHVLDERDAAALRRYADKVQIAGGQG